MPLSELSRSELVKRFNVLNAFTDNFEYHISELTAIIDDEEESIKLCVMGLRSLADSFNKHLQCLESLDQPVGNRDALIVYLMLIKVDPITRREWKLTLMILLDSQSL